MRKKPGDEAFRASFKFLSGGWDQRLADFNRFSQSKHGIVTPVYHISMIKATNWLCNFTWVGSNIPRHAQEAIKTLRSQKLKKV